MAIKDNRDYVTPEQRAAEIDQARRFAQNYTIQKIQDYYNQSANRKWLSKEDEEQKRKQLAALRESYSQPIRGVNYGEAFKNVFDAVENNITAASRYRSYDQWGQQTGSQTYVADLQRQLDNLQSQLTTTQQKMTTMNGNQIMNTLASNDYRNLVSKINTTTEKLKNTNVELPSKVDPSYTFYSNRTDEQLQNDLTTLDKIANPTVYDPTNSSPDAANKMAVRKEAADNLAIVKQIIAERQIEKDTQYFLDKLNADEFDGTYDATNKDALYQMVNGTYEPESPYRMGADIYVAESQFDEMTNEEKQLFNSIYKNDGKAEALKYLEFLQRDLNLRDRIKTETAAKEFAEDSPFWSSVASVGAKLTAPVMLARYVQDAFYYDGDSVYDSIDQNQSYFRPSQTATAIRNEISTNLTNDHGSTAAFIYQGAMSMADNVAQMLTTGMSSEGAILAIMGSSVFTDSLVEMKDSGKSDAEAVLTAFVRSGIEVVTEKAGLDEVFKVTRGSGISQLLRAAFAEGGEEGVSNLANLLFNVADASFRGEENDLEKDVEKYIKLGFSKSEAIGLVFENRAEDLGLDVLAGALSGFLLGGGNWVASKGAQAGYKVSDIVGAISKEMAETTLDDQIEKALSLNSDSKAYKSAESLEKAKSKLGQSIQQLNQIRLNNAQETREFKETHEKSKEEFLKTDAESLDDVFEEAFASATNKIQQAAVATAYIQAHAEVTRDEIQRTNATTEEGTVDQAVKVLRVGFDTTIQLSNGEIISLDNLDFGNNNALRAAYNNAKIGIRKTSDVNDYIADFQSLNGMVSPNFFDTVWKTAHKMGANKATVEQVKNNEAVATTLKAYEEVDANFNMGAIDTVIQHALNDGFNSAIKVTEGAKQLVKEMAKLTGQEVEFVDGLQDGKGNAVQGMYDAKTGKILISTTTKNPATVVFCHELTHAMQQSDPKAYALYKEAILDKLQKSEDTYKFIREQVESTYRRNANETEEAWKEKVDDEITAIASENYLVESAFVDSLKENRNLFRRIKNVVLNRYQRTRMDTVRRRMNDVSKEDADWFKKLSELWVDVATKKELDDAALEEYRKELFKEELPNDDLTPETMEDVKDSVDEGEAVTPQAETQFSREFDEDFMDKALKENLKNGIEAALVDPDTMEKARQIRKRTKYLLEQYKRFLPEDKMGKDWKTKNGSYDISGDLGTVCVRSLAVEPLMDFIADKIGHPLTAEETTYISQELMNYTHVPPCVYCYVAMDRNAKRDFLNTYINWREDTIKNFRSGMNEDDVKKAFLKYNYKSGSRKMNDKLKSRYDLWKKMAFDPSVEMIGKSDLTSVERMEERSKVSESFALQIKDALDYAQSASYAKGVIGYTAYNNEILKWKPDRIKKLNRQYGMRMYSFTDYHPAFVLENMQMITDAAVKGLKVLAYTKEIDFARIFMRTGANINISIFAQKEFTDGTFHQDGMMGADWELAKQARQESNKYGGNVGITMVAINDEQVEWACQQDWIDVVIPFHTVKADQFADLNKWSNYKGVQEEKKLLSKADSEYWSEDEEWTPGEWKKGMKKEIMPQDHANDYDTYIRACKKNHLKPKFEQWYEKWGKNGDETTRKWYMKLVVETRRSYNMTDPVQPIFNYDAAEESVLSLTKPYDAPIGTTAEGYEDITIEQMAKEISDKMKSQTFSDGRLSRDFEDVGYHAGDLGKAEALSNQSGSRDTGHFGTGTYFVGNQERIKGYNSRDGKPAPVERVDFSRYNLFKPKNYSDASTLHQFMRRVDGWIGRYEGAKSEAEYNDYKEQLTDVNYEFYENGQQETVDDIDAYLFSNYEAEERRSDAEIIDDVVRLADATIGRRELSEIIAKYSNENIGVSNDGTLYLFDENDTEYTPAEYLKRIPRSVAERIIDWVDTEASNWRSGGLERATRYEDWYDTFDEVADILGVSSDTLESAITEATEEANDINYPESTTADSIATRVMKKLGYEGVDVRHINGMDNTTYGSVIYDLKGDALKRKQEIGTARFSLEIKYQNGTTDSISNLREVTDEQIEGYLKLAADRKLYGHAYIPVLRHTPKVLLDSLRNSPELSEAGIKFYDLPMIMQVNKVQQSLATKATKKGSTPHKLTKKELLNIIKGLSRPFDIIYEPGYVDDDGNEIKDRVAVFVEVDNFDEGFAVIEFDADVDEEFVGDSGDQNFNTVVTAYIPKVDYYDRLANNERNIIVPIKEEDVSSNPLSKEPYVDSEESPLSDNTVAQEGEERNHYSREFESEEGTGSVDSEYIDKVAGLLEDVDISKVKLTDQQIEKIAKRVLRGTGSEYSKEELAENLKKVFAYIKTNGKNYNAITRVMSDVMMPVVESIYDYSGDTMKRNTIKGKTFIISQETAKTIGIKNINQRMLPYGVRFTTNENYNNPKRQTIRLVDGWAEVASDLGLSEDINNEAEMVNAMYDFITTEKTSAGVQAVSPENREQYAFQLVLQAYDEYIGESRVSLKDVNRRAEENAAKVAQQRIQKITGEYTNKMLDLMKQGETEIEAEKSRLQEKAEKAKWMDRLRKEWKRFENHVKHPNKGRHFNPSYMKYIEDFADMIDLRSASKNSKRNTFLSELADEYRRLASLDIYDDRAYDPTIENKIRDVEKMIDGRPIRNLNSDEIKQVYNVIRAFIHKATHQDEFANRAIGATVYEATEETIKDVESARGLTDKNSFADTFLMKSLNPMRAFARITDYHEKDPLYKAADAIMRGEIDVNRHKMDFALIFREMQPNQFESGTAEHTKAKEYLKRYNDMNKKTVTVRLGGEDIEITEAQRLELIMDARNQDNMVHILYGGLLVPDAKQFKRGNMRLAYNEGRIIKPSESEMYKLNKDLDEFEKWFLQKSIQYFDYAQDLINETSLQVDGFARADVDYYYPIRVAEDWVNASYDSLTGMDDYGESINSGYLKERTKSKKPIYLNGINQTLQRHQNFTSRYAGLAIPLSDFNKIYNGKIKTETGDILPLRRVINQKWGSHATQYIKDALDDLRKGRTENTKLDKIRGNAAQAILTLNPSVSIKQAASFPTAIAELDYASVAKAFVRGGKNNWMLSSADRELIAKYTPILWSRMQGMSTQEIAELSQDRGGLVNRGMSAVPWLTQWIQKVDVATVGRLWYASQYWVDSHHKNLEKGSEKYYQTVAKKFEDVVTKTQPNYSVFTRPDILRSNNGLMKAIMMFKTQPLQNFGILYEATSKYAAKWRQYRAAKGTAYEGAARAERVAAGHQMYRALTSQIIQTAVFTGMTFIANALILHRWDKYKDEDLNEVTVASVLEQMMWDYIGSFMGNAVLGDFVEGVGEYFVRKFALDEDPQLHGLSVFGIDTLNEGYELIDKISSAFKDGDATKAWKNVIKFAEKIATLYGIPAENIVKVFQSGWMYGQDIINDYPIDNLEREGIPVLFEFQKTSNEQYWNRVKRAYEQGDKKLVDKRFKDMIEKTKKDVENKDGSKYTKIGAIGLLSVDDKKGVMEWVSNLYLNGTAEDKRMVEGWLDDISEYSSNPEKNKKDKIKAFYEFQDKELPAELMDHNTRKYRDWEYESYGEQFDKAFSNFLNGRAIGSLPTKKGEGACSTQMARLWQMSTDKDAVWRFAVEVLGYKDSGRKTTTKGWEEKDLNDRYKDVVD